MSSCALRGQRRKAEIRKCLMQKPHTLAVSRCNERHAMAARTETHYHPTTFRSGTPFKYGIDMYYRIGRLN